MHGFEFIGRNMQRSRQGFQFHSRRAVNFQGPERKNPFWLAPLSQVACPFCWLNRSSTNESVLRSRRKKQEKIKNRRENRKRKREGNTWWVSSQAKQWKQAETGAGETLSVSYFMEQRHARVSVVDVTHSVKHFSRFLTKLEFQNWAEILAGWRAHFVLLPKCGLENFGIISVSVKNICERVLWIPGNMTE